MNTRYLFFICLLIVAIGLWSTACTKSYPKTGVGVGEMADDNAGDGMDPLNNDQDPHDDNADPHNDDYQDNSDNNDNNFDLNNGDPNNSPNNNDDDPPLVEPDPPANDLPVNPAEEGSGNEQCPVGLVESCECPQSAGLLSCLEDDTWGECQCLEPGERGLLAQYEALIVGVWDGEVTESNLGRWPVRIVFRADGTYDTACLEPYRQGRHTECQTFFYGLDNLDIPLSYRLTDIRTNDDGLGWIEVASHPDNIRRGTVDALTFSNRGWSMQFEFTPSWDGDNSRIFTVELGRVGL